MEPIKSCPICGSRKVERVHDTVKFPTKSGVLTVPDLDFDVCRNCGESFFDHTASQKIDAIGGIAGRGGSGRKSA
jgi:YgiT-type zinc finger domain-containing protein